MILALDGIGIGLLASQPLGWPGRASTAASEPGRRAGGTRVDAERLRPDDPRAADESFEARYRPHATEVARLCRRMLGSAVTSEDAAADVFLRARRGFESYDSDQPFRRWLLAVAGNHCIDQIRRRSREARLFDPRDLDAQDLVDTGPSPLRRALASERRSQLLEAIDGLPLKYRLPLVLRYFQDLDYQAIAEALDVTRSQVATLLFRAKRQLRQRLAEDEQ